MNIKECKDTWQNIKEKYEDKLSYYGISTALTYHFEDGECEESFEQTDTSTDFFVILTVSDPAVKKRDNEYEFCVVYSINEDGTIEESFGTMEETIAKLDAMLERFEGAENPHAAYENLLVEEEKIAKAKMREIMRGMVPWWALKLALVIFILAAILAIIALKMSHAI